MLDRTVAEPDNVTGSALARDCATCMVTVDKDTDLLWQNPIFEDPARLGGV